jgi:hypothetical protein
VVQNALKLGNTFTDAMIAGYTAVLCSPGFIYLEEKPGRLDDYEVAARLAFFLWNSPPDEELRRCADQHELRKPGSLRAQAERLLADPKSRRFVDAFTDYWLDLRKILATAPDANLYSDYYLDDLLTESALEETRLFFAELLREDLPARDIVAADFAMLNDRLAAHYGLPPVAAHAAAEGQPAGRNHDPGCRSKSDGQRHHHLASPSRSVDHGADSWPETAAAAAERSRPRARYSRRRHNSPATRQTSR